MKSRLLSCLALTLGLTAQGLAGIPFRLDYHPNIPFRPDFDPAQALLASAEMIGRQASVDTEEERIEAAQALLASLELDAVLSSQERAQAVSAALFMMKVGDVRAGILGRSGVAGAQGEAMRQSMLLLTEWLREILVPAGLGFLVYTVLYLLIRGRWSRLLREARRLRGHIEPTAETRLAEAQEALAGDTARLAELERERLDRERRATAVEARARRLERVAHAGQAISGWGLTLLLLGYLAWVFLEHAGWEVVSLFRDPFVLQFLFGKVIVIGVILIAINAVRLVVRVLVSRLLGRMGRADTDDRSDRDLQVQTLANVLNSAASIVLWTLAIFMTLDQLGLNITTLLAAAGVAGIAIGFGAQTLVRDFLSGLFILLENQFRVGDIVKIGTTGGLVERITLRATSLRDVAGSLHIIPNGQIDRVTNMTFNWSRHVADIAVSYRADPDRVIALLADVGRKMRREEPWSQRLIDDPEVAGLDRFEDSALVFRVLLKTKPLQQWAVGREFNRRVKYALDEAGIEIPFPHRTVYLRLEPEDELAQVLRGATRPGGEPLSPR